MSENMVGVDEECKEAVDDAVRIPFSLFQVTVEELQEILLKIGRAG